MISLKLEALLTMSNILGNFFLLSMAGLKWLFILHMALSREGVGCTGMFARLCLGFGLAVQLNQFSDNGGYFTR